jgi:hypothetical protein
MFGVVLHVTIWNIYAHPTERLVTLQDNLRPGKEGRQEEKTSDDGNKCMFAERTLRG